MPESRLILHVKGTDSETTELPKDAVREALSQGQITQSQLIWSAADNTWKQVREAPELLQPTERLILHVKGTEAETKELPKQAVRAAISQGQISHSQLIWSSSDSAWKQVRELPELLPSQKLAPAPAREPVVPAPKVAEAIRQEPAAVAVARVAATVPHVRVAEAAANVPPAATPASTPQVRVAERLVASPQVRVSPASTETPAVQAKVPESVSSARSHVVHEDEEGHPLKWVCIGLGILIVLVLGGNFLLVDQPLVSRLGQTSYSNVTIYAHLGAFMQPSVMVIHIPNSSKITPDNLTDFMVALAHSTPQSPFTRDVYDRVALTSGWTAQYSFSGGNWKQLGDMDRDSAAARKDFIMSTMGDASGQTLVESTLNEAALQEKREKVWNAFVAHFTSNQ